MKQKIFVLAGFLSILLLWTGCPNNTPVPAGSGSGSSGGGCLKQPSKLTPQIRRFCIRLQMAQRQAAVSEKVFGAVG